MPATDDVAILCRQYKGVIQSLDPSFIGKDYLQSSQNWHPADLTFLLAKRRGTAPYSSIANASRLDRMLRVRSAAGDLYFFAVAHDTTLTVDVVRALKGDPPTAFADLATTTGRFAAYQQRYGMALFDDRVWIGNGVDPLKEIPLTDPLTATDLTQLTLLGVTGASATLTADTASRLLSGTHFYRWALYNTSSKTWISISAVQTIATTGARQRIDFVAPSTAAGTNQAYHLFVSPANQEIEGAHDQTPAGLAASGTFSLLDEPTIDGVPVPIPSTVSRTGRFLVPHRGRLFFGGDTNDPRGFFATDVLRPGAEQAIFNAGTFFPANAYGYLADELTGIGVGSLSTAQRDPTAPLALFTTTSTHLLVGDIVDDPSAELVTVSNGHIGCIAQASIANTPMGMLWCGHESVYVLRPESSEPVDIGWPIWNVIRQIPRPMRSFVEAVWHKGFYKLAVPIPGETRLTVQWWLDLRRPFDPMGSVPPWWGPMVMPAFTCFAQSERETLEDDRAWLALDGVGTVLLVDQPNSYEDGSTPIASLGKTGRLDDGQPFGRKLFTRQRAIARVPDTTSLAIEVAVDGVTKTTGVMTFVATPGADFDVSDFDVSDFQSFQDVEGEFISPVDRPRGQAMEISFAHSDPTDIILRDLETRYDPIDRKVGSRPGKA